MKNDAMRYQPKLRIKSMTVAQTAYLAGMIDGEGSICITRRNDPESRTGYFYRAVLHVASTHADVLATLQHWTGLGRARVFDEPRQNRKARWQWMTWSNQAAQVVRTVLPYLVIKERQAEVFLQFVKHKAGCRSPGRRGLSAAQWKIQANFYKTMKRLNA